jgi:asparagine synthetase B (glutamine-hydrolysing)
LQEPTTEERQLELKSNAEDFMSALSLSVRKRVSMTRRDDSNIEPCIGVLFSGGLDSAVLAALVGSECPAGEPVELINVAFINWGVDSQPADIPDRAASREAVLELR